MLSKVQLQRVVEGPGRLQRRKLDERVQTKPKDIQTFDLTKLPARKQEHTRSNP